MVARGGGGGGEAFTAHAEPLRLDTWLCRALAIKGGLPVMDDTLFVLEFLALSSNCGGNEPGHSGASASAGGGGGRGEFVGRVVLCFFSDGPVPVFARSEKSSKKSISLPLSTGMD